MHNLCLILTILFYFVLEHQASADHQAENQTHEAQEAHDENLAENKE